MYKWQNCTAIRGTKYIIIAAMYGSDELVLVLEVTIQQDGPPAAFVNGIITVNSILHDLSE